MLTKLLTLILLIVVVWFGYKVVARLNANAKARRDEIKGGAGLPRPRPNAEEMVRCASCGVYVSSTKATSCGRPDCPYR